MAMRHFEGARSQEIDSMNLDPIKAYLTDLASSNNENAPITAGFFRMEAGESLEYTYSYDECKLMLEGEMTLSEQGGATVTLRPGDVVFFDRGTTVIFSSRSSGTVFYVGQRKEGEL